jgi:hypothetical protein
MPAAPAAASHVDGIAHMIGGLGNGLAIGRSRRSARDPDQAHARCHDDGKHQMTHVDSSLLQWSKLAIELPRRKADGSGYPLRHFIRPSQNVPRRRRSHPLRRKMTLRLLAGIGTVSVSAKP